MIDKTNHTLDINTILHTKDGTKIGNGIIIGRIQFYWEVTTDYGNKVQLTAEQIEERFVIAWSHYKKEIHMYSCDEMQEMMSADHKHRVEPTINPSQKNG
jgi:uncharacterized protein YlaI